MTMVDGKLHYITYREAFMDDPDKIYPVKKRFIF